MYGINIVNIFLSGKRKNIFFLFIAGSSCLMAFKLIISHLHASARLGNICAGNRCPLPRCRVSCTFFVRRNVAV